MGKAEGLMAEYMAKNMPQPQQTQNTNDESDGETDDDDIDIDTENVFWRNLKEGEFKFGTQATKGNAVAGRWARMFQNEKDLKSAYESTKGNVAKANFRSTWAKGNTML